MSQIIDRRLNGRNKGAVNRQRFIRRFKAQIRRAAAEAIAGRSITDTRSGENVDLPARDISEPAFRHGSGGRREQVHPGNREFVTGDRVPRPDGGAGGVGGGQPGDGSDGEDTFAFELSPDEFLDCFFEDLELPDLVETQLRHVVEFTRVRAGFSREGIPANINIVRSLRGALARRIALRAPYLERLRELQAELEDLRSRGLGGGPRARELQEEMDRLKVRIDSIPYIDTFDLRYNNHTNLPKPTTRAVMFCLMDVSGSMDEARKDMAKRFFILLYLFLLRTYERIEVVFIRHHVTAKEVEEEEFFHARETGGTVVSSALELMSEIIGERYPTADWNIYGAQASDGENWGNDSLGCRDILGARLMPLLQYFAYVEVRPDRHQALWEAYAEVAAAWGNFSMQEIHEPRDIFPVFRKLLVKRAT